MQSEIEALIERVEHATGKDRSLDDAIWHWYWKSGVENGWGYDLNEAPFYTSSIDAAVALVERCLLGWSWQVNANESGQHYQAILARSHPTNKQIVAEMPDKPGCAALALCLALLRALAQKEKRTR